MERGHVIPQVELGFAARLAELLGAPTSTKPARINRPIVDMRERWIALDQRISELDPDFAVQANGDQLASGLLTIPGVGTLNATALVAAVGDARTFARGRDLATWLGLVPR